MTPLAAVGDVVMHTRLFELGELVSPPPVPGRLRLVRPEEAERALDWMRQFLLDADVQAGRDAGAGHGPGAVTLDDVRRKVAQRVLWFWENETGTPVHLIGANPPAYGAARIGPVFTPGDHRGHGYASAAVAVVSRMIGRAGSRPILFTDQANPTSNRLYLALGYRPVVDNVHLAIR